MDIVSILTALGVIAGFAGLFYQVGTWTTNIKLKLEEYNKALSDHMVHDRSSFDDIKSQMAHSNKLLTNHLRHTDIELTKLRKAFEKQ